QCKRGVGTSNQYVNRSMIELLEEGFQTRPRERMVQCRCQIHQNQTTAIYDRAGDMKQVTIGYCPNQHEYEGDNCCYSTNAMSEGMRDFFSNRVCFAFP